MSKALDSLEPEFKEIVINLIEKLKTRGIDCIVTSGRRTIEEQNKLFAQGRTTKGNIVTKAQGGQSPHNFGLGADLCPINPKDGSLWWNAPDDVWQCLALTAKELGLDAGYFFRSIKDSPHVQMVGWEKTRDSWRKGEIKVA